MNKKNLVVNLFLELDVNTNLIWEHEFVRHKKTRFVTNKTGF